MDNSLKQLEQNPPAQDDLAVELNGQTMANDYNIKYIASPQHLESNPPATVKADIETLFLTINQQMSIYQSNSEISLFNRAKTVEPINISADFARVVEEALRIANLTDGGLDITLAPIIDAWGFGVSERLEEDADDSARQQRVAACAPAVGMDKIELVQRDGEWYLRKTHPDVSLDLCAIAKGFGVDKAADYLEAHGVNHYLVNIGGELRSKGVNPHAQAWRVGIEKPDNSQEIHTVVALKNQALATSANYRNFYTNAKGEHICHIIDYQTHQPTRSDILSLSVIADSCMTADGLATALLALGKDKALALAERENLAMYLITLEPDGAFKPYASLVFQQYFDHL